MQAETGIGEGRGVPGVGALAGAVERMRSTPKVRNNGDRTPLPAIAVQTKFPHAHSVLGVYSRIRGSYQCDRGTDSGLCRWSAGKRMLKEISFRNFKSWREAKMDCACRASTTLSLTDNHLGRF
jgi:hypothetical protein